MIGEPTRRDVATHTEAEIAGAVAFALDLVADVDPPGDLRGAVFTAAVNLHSSKQILWEQPPVPVLGLGLQGQPGRRG